MTSKRLKKLWMSQGVPRDTAEFVIKHIAYIFPDGRKASNKEKYENLIVKTERIK